MKRGTHSFSGGKRNLVQPFQRRIWQNLTEVHIHLYFNSEILFLGIYLKEDTSQQYENTHVQGYSIIALQWQNTGNDLNAQT